MEEDDDLLTLLRDAKYSRNVEFEDQVLSNRDFIKFTYKLSTIDADIKNLKETLETVEGEDARWIQENIRDLQNKLHLLRLLFQIVPRADEKQLDDWYKRDLMQLPMHQRWMMYQAWRRKALDIQEQRAAKIEELYHQSASRLKDVRTLESAEICESADIVGFTTTGAANNRALLNHLKPKIGKCLASFFLI